jgi:hypothetical protein
MANPLTGDFDAVLQVSGSTINRLLATMHQNIDEKSELPRFPHSVAMRIGDPTPIDGMRGTAWAQLSVPRIDLIHGKDDRFNLEVGIRVRYKPDPGTTPLPEFIHGTVRAQYKIQKIDPNCFGWSKAAADYIWIRVDAPTVSFDGSAVDDTNPFIVVQPPDPAQVDARITRLVMYLLKRKFQATPQKVEGRFRRGAMRSLNVGINRSAVAVPLAGQGQLASINQELLDGRDFGVAVSKSFILANIQRELDALQTGYRGILRVHSVTRTDFLGDFDFDVLTLNIGYTVTLTSATADWWGGTLPLVNTSVGLITIKIAGSLTTQKSIFNLTFDLTQLVMLTFDAGAEGFVVSLVGSPTINVYGPAALVIEADDKQKFADGMKDTILAEVNKLVGFLSVTDRKTELIDQLKKLDPTPDAYFDEAVFSADGVVVRGQILLSGRRAASTEFVKTSEQDGFDAFKSWIPGGRINSFDWTWTWMYSNQPGGSTSHADRFLLRRPAGVHRSNFGMFTDLSRPLPVLDGFGSMCLTVRGDRVHSVTGATVPIVVARKCMRAGFDIRIQGAGGRVFLKEWVVGPRDPIGPVQEVSLIDVSGGRTDRAPNTLVIRAGERWNPDIGATLRDALMNSRRVDAGLQVLLLFNDGTLSSAGHAIEELSHLAGDLAAPLMVNEDVRGTWSAALAMDPRDGDVQWRLVTPTGGVSWGHRGAIEVREFAKVLDDYLFPAPPASVRPLSPGITPGTRITTGMLDAGLYDDIAHHLEREDPCPPPIGPYSSLAVAVFAQGDSVSSQAVVKRVAREYGEGEGDRPFVVVVVDGARPEDLERLKDTLPEEFVAIPDPQGHIASQLGVRTWPTKVTIKEGVVTAVDVGAEFGSPSRDTEAAS